MKKFAIFSILILALSAGWHYRFEVRNLLKRSPEITNLVHESVILDSIRREVFAPPPLRAGGDFFKSNLTTDGVITWTNTQRQTHGLTILRHNNLLDHAASDKLQDMFSNQYFEHVSLQGRGPSDLARDAGYDFIAIGENLALGNFKDDQTLVQAWMDSPGHRENILQPRFQEIGVAVGKGTFQGKKVWIAVQEFGKPASACARVSAELKNNIEAQRNGLDRLENELRQQKQALDADRPKTAEQYDEHNRRVADYNDRVRGYNAKLQELKSMISRYNSQVKTFNECIGT